VQAIAFLLRDRCIGKLFPDRYHCWRSEPRERLDPALIRPGRCDVKQLVDDASRDQMRRLFVRVFKGYGANAAAFAAALPDGESSMAKLQGFLLEHKGDLSGASAV